MVEYKDTLVDDETLKLFGHVDKLGIVELNKNIDSIMKHMPEMMENAPYFDHFS